MTEEEISKVEEIINQKIRANHSLVERRNLPIAEAQKLGAMALFGEKYGDSVRVIQFGTSIELCGGTHVPATGQIGILKIVSEGAISAGIRRIEAITADKAEQFINDALIQLKDAKATLNITSNLAHGIQKLLDENRRLEKEIETFIKEKLVVLKGELKANAKEINGITLITATLNLTPEAVKDLAYQLRGEISNVAFIAGTISADKPSLTIMLGDELVKKSHNAATIVREAAKEIQGGGGGQPFFATAGGKNVAGLNASINKAVALITKKK